jgi:hypothetical protein
VGLIAREVEQKDISTVTLNMFLDIAKKVIPPRTINVDFPFGAPFGDPNNRSLQMKVIRESLNMLENSKKPGEIKKLPFDWRDELN